MNVYLTALESLPHLRLLQEMPLLSTKPQELTNSLREEWDETLQPSFCPIYNPFMTKREYCIRRMQEVVQAKIFVFLQLSFHGRSEPWQRQMQWGTMLTSYMHPAAEKDICKYFKEVIARGPNITEIF